MISVPNGMLLCKTPQDISAWELGILKKIQVETHIPNKASIVALITGIAQCALEDDTGHWRIEATKRHLSALTGLSPSAVWRGLKWLGDEGLLLLTHSAYMRSRCQHSIFFPLIPAGTNSASGSSSTLPRSLSPVSLHLKNNGATWSQREAAPVTSLSDPRHNIWFGHRTGWLLYVTVFEQWTTPITVGDLRKATGLSRHGMQAELEWLLSEGILEYLDADGPWEGRLLHAPTKTEAEEVLLDQGCFDRRGELMARIRAEREIHRRWIAAGCKTKLQLTAQWQRCAQAFTAMIRQRAALQGVTP